MAVPSRNALAPAESRLADFLLGDARFELSVLIDGRTPRRRAGRTFDIAIAAEAAIFRRTGTPHIPRHAAALDAVRIVRLADAAGAAGVDVIVDFTCDPNALLLAAYARFGLWRLDAFNHAAGFAEAARRAPFTMVALVRHGAGGSAHKIAEAAYGTKFLSSHNAAYIREKSVQLIQRELARLALTGAVEDIGAPAPPPHPPGPVRVATYALGLALPLSQRLLSVAKDRLGLRPGMWLLKHGKGDPTSFDPAATAPVVAADNSYWADPFLLRRHGRTYVFFEDFPYRSRRGHISAGVIEDGRFTLLGAALTQPHHLSYPFVFEWQGDVFMMPETHQSGRLEIWRAANFPLGWELHATGLEGLRPVDSVLLEDSGAWWLFTNLCRDSFGDYCTELHVFRIDGPDLGSVEPHPLNPVVIDCRTARGGGRVFRHEGRLLRVSQNNSRSNYGYGLNIMEIDRLDAEGYAEHLVRAIVPDFEPGIIGCHHADFADGAFIVDVRRR